MERCDLPEMFSLLVPPWCRRGRFASHRITAALCAVLGLLAGATHLEAQSPPGTDYWFSPVIIDSLDPENGSYISGLELIADTTANVEVTGALTWSGTVGPDQPQSIDLLVAPVLSEDGVVSDKGIHITSDAPVIAVWRNWFGAYDDAALLTPTPALGTDYLVVTYPWVAQGYGAGFHVTATEDATTVEYVDICDFANPLVSVQLDRGQTYMDVCQKRVEGFRVTSDKPIAVMAVTHGQYIPYDPAGCCADPVVEQMRPVSDWGTEHYVPRLPRGPETTDPKDFVRVGAVRDATDIVIDGPGGTINDTLTAGQIREYDLEGPLHVTSSDAVAVQVTYKSEYVTDKGDPYSLLITPERASHPAYRVFFPDMGAYWEYFLTVITEDGPTAGLTLNGQPVTGAWLDIPGTTRQQLDLPVDPGTYLLEAARPMTAYAHAYVIHESLAYPAGPSRVVPTCEAQAEAGDLELCPGDEPRLDAGGSLVVRCSGDTEYRWLEDGLPLGPFTTDPTFLADPPVGETTYSLEVRCSSDIACADRADFLVTRHPPGPLEDVGNTLRMVKLPAFGPARVFLDWRGFSPPGLAGEHYHAYRSASPTGPFERLDSDPDLLLRTIADTDPSGSLLAYEVRIADTCESLSADAYPHTVPSDCFETALACSHSVTTELEPTCPADIDQHPCASGPTDGEERTHSLTVPADGLLRIDLIAEDPDLEVYLYDAGLTQCIEGVDGVIEENVPAGDYRVFVDAPSGNGGPYTLEVRCP